MYRRDVSHVRPAARGCLGKVQHVKRALAAAPVEEVELLTGQGRKTIPGHHGQGATEVQRAGHCITIELDAVAHGVTGVGAADFCHIGIGRAKTVSLPCGCGPSVP